MKKLAKVKGREGLAKDPATGAVVNTDTNAFRQAKLAKKRILEAKEKQDKLQDRVDRLERLVEQLIDKDNHNDPES